MDPRVVYCTPFFIAAMLIFVVAIFAYRRREVRGAWYLTFVCLAASAWAASEGMLYFGLDIESNILITKFQYLGITPLPPLALLFVISVFGFGYLVNRTRLLLLFLIAMIIIILVWTNPIHKLIFTDYYTIDSGPFPMLGLKHGLLWWIIIFYHYSLTAILSVVVLLEVFSSASFHRAQAMVILVAVTVAWGLNAVYVSGNSPVPNMDIGPLAFTLVAASMAWGFFRYSLLDILPIARSEIFLGLDDAILVIDERDRIMDINPAAEFMFGIGVTEAIGQGALQFFGDHPQLHRLLGEMRPAEVCLITEDQERMYNVRGSALKDKRGVMLGRVIVLRNITDRMQAEEELRQSKERYRSVFKNTGAATMIVEEDTTISTANAGFEELSGYSKEEIEGKKSWTEFVVKEDLDRMKEYHDKRRKNIESAPTEYEFQFIDKQGNIKDIFLKIGMIPGTKRSVASLIDITFLKQAQEEIVKRQKYMESVVHSAPDAIVTLDASHCIIEWNPGAERLFGYTRDEVVGKDLDDLISLPDMKHELKALTKQILSAEMVLSHETVRYRKDGTPVNVIAAGSPILIKGELHGAVAVYTDITERKKLESQLRQTQKMEPLAPLQEA